MCDKRVVDNIKDAQMTDTLFIGYASGIEEANDFADADTTGTSFQDGYLASNFTIAAQSQGVAPVVSAPNAVASYNQNLAAAAAAYQSTTYSETNAQTYGSGPGDLQLTMNASGGVMNFDATLNASQWGGPSEVFEASISPTALYGSGTGYVSADISGLKVTDLQVVNAVSSNIRESNVESGTEDLRSAGSAFINISTATNDSDGIYHSIGVRASSAGTQLTIENGSQNVDVYGNALDTSGNTTTVDFLGGASGDDRVIEGFLNNAVINANISNNAGEGMKFLQYGSEGSTTGATWISLGDGNQTNTIAATGNSDTWVDGFTMGEDTATFSTIGGYKIVSETFNGVTSAAVTDTTGTYGIRFGGMSVQQLTAHTTYSGFTITVH